MPADTLPDDLHAAIEQLCSKGDAHVEDRRYDAAIAEYNLAWDMLPEPKTQWEAATWILAAVGDAYFKSDRMEEALDAFGTAMHCPDALGNPFLHLRLGQILLDDGQRDKAADELMRAYMGGGPEIFDEEDGRYLAFLRTRANLD